MLQIVQGQECYMSWCCWKSTNVAGTGMLDVAVLQEIYRWCRGRQECYMWWCCRKATDGAGTGMLGVVVLQESYRWCRDRNARCCGVAGNLKMVQGQEC